MKRLYLAALLATGSGIAIAAPGAQAQAVQADYDIAAQRLADALNEYSRISARDVIGASRLVEGRRSAEVKGRLAPEVALARLLSGTGLVAELVDGTLILRAQKDRGLARAATDERADAAIIVTGTRIRGTGPVGSPVTTIDREALDRSGRATVAEFIQTIPQNFSGGPAEANVGYSARGYANSNLSYGTGINLRGLGSGSTLTLFDGARPALGGSSGAFTDLSLIPSGAIERIEILTDGASRSRPMLRIDFARYGGRKEQSPLLLQTLEAGPESGCLGRAVRTDNRHEPAAVPQPRKRGGNMAERNIAHRPVDMGRRREGRVHEHHIGHPALAEAIVDRGRVVPGHRS